MKKTFYLSQLAMAAVILSLVACSKNNADPEPEPEPEPTAECSHTDLDYVEAIQRTATTMGNIEHWHCNGCNRNFSDEKATQELPKVYLRAKNYSISPALLNKIQHIYPFVPASQQTKADKGMIPSAVTFLHHKVQAYKFREYSIAVFKELEEIDQQLSMIESQVEEIQKQNTLILAKLDDSDFADAVDEMFNKGKFIWENSHTFFDYVVKYYTQFANGEISQLQLRHLIKQTCLQWSYCSYQGEAIYDLTTRVIEQFSCYAIDRKTMTYPQIFHKYNSDYRLWDHEGYTDRKQMDIESESVLSLGYFMASLYRENAKDYALLDYRRDDSLKLSGYYDLIEPLVLKDIENMQKAREAYRYFHDGTNEMFICKDAIVANTDEVINKIVRDHDSVERIDKTDKSKNYLITYFNTTLDNKYGLGLSQGTTLLVEDYTTILNNYSNGNIYQVLRDSAEVVGMPLFHEKRSVDGTDRTLVLRYTSPKLNSFSGSSGKCSKYGHTGYLKYLRVYYDEFSAYASGCGCDGAYHTMDMQCYEMGTNCQRCADYKLLLGRIYCGVDNSRLEYAWALGKNDDWVPNENALVFLKKYTGTIWDPFE